MSLVIDPAALAALGVTQEDIEDLERRVKDRRNVDIGPPFSDFQGRLAAPFKEQLTTDCGYPSHYRIDTTKLWESLELYATESQKKGLATKPLIYRELQLKKCDLWFAGEQVMSLLFKNQGLIPKEYRDRELLFWTGICYYSKDSAERFVPCLFWSENGFGWQEGCFSLDRHDNASQLARTQKALAVVLRRK